MPSNELVTRGAIARRMAVNAATKPLNVAVLGGLIVVGIVLDLVVVVGAIAIVAYLVLLALTFFDADVRALIADLEAQREATVRLQERLERFEVGMRRICASLGLLRTRLVEMSASEEEAAQRELARQSRELRERTDLLAESMAEVFAGDDDELRLPVAEHR